MKRFIPSILVMCAALFFLFQLSDGIFFSRKPKAPPLLHVNPLTSEKKNFVLIVSSNNPGKFLDRNVKSILDQEYEAFRVIYIDDGLKQEEYTKLLSLIENSAKREKFELRRNQVHKGEVENIYGAIQSCKDDEIILLLRDRDWLAHDDVLDCLNRCYADNSVWMTYGSHVVYPFYKRGKYNKAISDKVLQASSLRSYCKKHVIGWHLISGYASLFKKIKKVDLCREGKFLRAASDFAFVLPLIEMSRKHARYVPDILYVYNRSNYLETLKQEREGQLYVQSLNPYPFLISKREDHDEMD